MFSPSLVNHPILLTFHLTLTRQL